MAVTTQASTDLEVSQFGFGSNLKVKYGISVLSTGSATVSTGLSKVYVFLPIALDATVQLGWKITNTNWPSDDGDVTVVGEDTDGTAGASENFAWLAIGDK